MRLAMESSEFAAFIASIPADQLKQRQRDSRKRMERALNDDKWDDLLSNNYAQGISLAQQNISYEAWHPLYGAFRELLVPALYDAYGAEDPARYQAAILAMDNYINIVHTVIGRSYIDAKDQIAKDQELERRRLEQQLFESGKLALVGRLAATVAHEVNNPLEAIKNALYVATGSTPKDSQEHQLLEVAQSETERISRTLRQMTGLYRAEVSLNGVDINLVAQDCLRFLNWDLSKKGIKVQSNFHPNIPAVLGNADQLRQVFLNLFLNARDAMEKGGTLHVTTRLSDKGDSDFLAGKWALAEVQDTGVGISTENIRKVFEPFFSTKHEGNGLGLGLWVTQGIIEKLGGRIKVRSEQGHGTTFTIGLPIGGKNGESNATSSGGRRAHRNPNLEGRTGKRKLRRSSV